VVVTAGGTREPIDPVRFLGNRSTGKMGFAIAKAAADRGAIVDLVAAPSPLATPDNAARHDVTTALQMHEMVMSLAEGASAIVKAAAVADYRPAIYHQQKIKKDEQDPGHLELVRNPDILYDLGHHRFKGGRPVLIGFAAETDNGRRHATDKLQRKNVDLIVMNRVDAADAGFEVDTNAVTIYGVDGGPLEVTLRSKDEVAAAIWDEVEKLVITRGPVE
jgi:phosphopantothenoylcysteine decarboxylase/phosphopantothenate--cysteine ligase